MLPYQKDAKKLEKLLERLFTYDESTPDDVEVLRRPGPKPFSDCCNYNYANFS